MCQDLFSLARKLLQLAIRLDHVVVKSLCWLQPEKPLKTQAIHSSLAKLTWSISRRPRPINTRSASWG